MPIYEYACPHCDHEFELLTGMQKRDAAVTCPSCERKGAKRKLSVFSTGQAKPTSAAPSPACQQCDRFGSCPGAGF